MKKTVLSILTITALLSAEEITEKPLATHTEFGYIQTNGNTDTKTFNLDFNINKEWTKNIITFDLDGQYATADNIETKNKYKTEIDYGYKLTERFSLDYLTGYIDDKFSGFDYQFYTGPGIKYKALNKETQKLTLETNVLYALDRYEAVWADDQNQTLAYPYTGVTKDHIAEPAYKKEYASYQLKATFNHAFTKDTKFLQELKFRGAFEESDIYYAYSTTALTSKFTDIFSAGISYKVDYANKPADDKKKTDTTLALNLIIDY